MSLAHSTVPQPHARVEALDGVRGLAVLLVVMMHAMFFGVPLPGGPQLLDATIYARLVGLGWCGVDVFFVLSGFLITGILVRSKEAPHYLRNFYARRALRIFPLYYAVLVLLLFVLPRPSATGGEIAAYFLYVQNFVQAFGGDTHPDLARDVTWSLAIEEQFYLVWPTVVLFAKRRTLVRIAAAMVGFAIAARFVGLELGLSKPFFLTFCRFDALGAGALLALVPPPRRAIGWALLLGGVVSMVSVAYATDNSLPSHPAMQRWGMIGALALASGLLMVVRVDPKAAKAFTWRPLRSLGHYSYCIYLVHFLVVEKLAERCYGDLNKPATALQEWLVANVTSSVLLCGFGLACLSVSWGVGWCSWHLFERHALACKRFFPSGDGRS